MLYNVVVVFAIHRDGTCSPQGRKESDTTQRLNQPADMNQPRVSRCPILDPLPPPSPSPPSGLSQGTGFECPVGCIELGLVIYFPYGSFFLLLVPYSGFSLVMYFIHSRVYMHSVLFHSSTSISHSSILYYFLLHHNLCNHIWLINFSHLIFT